MFKIKSISVFIYSVLLMLISSCCYSVKCDCFDDMDSSIGLIFNMDSNSTSGFKRSEIENAQLIRYNQSGEAIDTNRLSNYGNYFEYYFNIPNYQASQVKSFRDTCNYRLLNEIGNVDVLISDIDIKGDFGGGCCDCYSNKSISFKVNGEQKYFEGSERSGATYAINKN